MTESVPSAPPEAAAATYTVPQLAALMQCSQRHVWRMLDLGQIPGVIRLGRLVRFSRKAVDQWLVKS
jgi:excisionase family DNA binding protein